MRISLRRKLVMTVAIPALVLCGSVLGVASARLRSRAVERMGENAARLAEIYAARLHAELDGVAGSCRMAAALLDERPGLSEAELDGLLQAVVASGDRVVAAAAYRSGSGQRLSAAAEAPAALASWPQVEGVPTWVRSARQGAGAWLSAAPPAADAGARMLYVAPFGGGGGPRGAVAVELDVAALRRGIGRLLTDTDFALLDSEGHYLSHPQPDFVAGQTIFELAARHGRPDVAELGRRMTAGESGLMRLPYLDEKGRQWVFYAPIPGTGFSFASSISEEKVLGFANSQLIVGIAITGAGLLLVVAILYVVAGRATAPLERLVAAVDRISRGDLDARVEESRAGDEIGDLGRAFNRMVADLRSYMETHARETAAREAVESELRVARRIQRSLLPDSFPAFPERPEFQLHAMNLPATQVAGDFFDFFFRDSRTLVVVMADVSGKGIPAALFMAVARTVIRNLVSHCDSPAETLRQANEILREDNIGSMYVTLFLGWYDTASGRLRYANAGHPRPYLLGAGGGVRAVGRATGPILGILEHQPYTEAEIALSPGESLLLYTDGVSEARDASGEFFGDERLAELLEAQGGEPVDRLCESLAHTVGRFQGQRPGDDITLMVLRRTGRASTLAA